MRTRLLVILLIAIPAPAAAQAAPVWSLESVIEGLRQPTSVAWTPDGRLFAAERDGQVRIVSPDGRVLRLFADLRSEVDSSGERGLLAIALDPAFRENGRVFMLLTRQRRDQPEDGGRATGQVISISGRTDDPEVADRRTLRVVVSGFASRSQVHAGGDLAFDDEGRLLASFGDGASDRRVDPGALRSQDLAALAGKLIRVDRRTGLGVADNPWFDRRSPAAVSSKVLARGFRNPFRIAVDPVDGAVWVGDVGWTSWEEIDRVPSRWRDRDRQLDFGWPCREGPQREPSYSRDPATGGACAVRGRPGRTADPVHAYPHGGGGASVTLGPVLSSPVSPSLPGRVVVGDFVRQTIGTIGDEGFRPIDAVRDDTTGPAQTRWGSVVDLAIAPDGRLAVVDIGAGTVSTLHPGTDRDDGGVVGPLGGWAVLLAALGSAALLLVAVITGRKSR